MSAWNPSREGSPGQKNRPVLWKLTRSIAVRLVAVAGGRVDEVHVVEPALGGVSELLVLLLPPGVLGALPAPADDRRPSVRRPARELGPGVPLAAQPVCDEPTAFTVDPDDRRAHRGDIGMPAAREVGAELGVADERSRRRVVARGTRLGCDEEPKKCHRDPVEYHQAFTQQGQWGVVPPTMSATLDLERCITAVRFIMKLERRGESGCHTTHRCPWYPATRALASLPRQKTAIMVSTCRPRA